MMAASIPYNSYGTHCMLMNEHINMLGRYSSEQFTHSF